MRRIISTIIYTTFFLIRIYSQSDTTIYYPNGKYYYKGNVFEGKKIGTWQLFDSTNRLLNNIEILNGNLCKVIPIYADSTKSAYFNAIFRKDTLVLNGEWYYNDNNGATKGQYSMGKKNGVWKYYNLGKLKYLIEYKTLEEKHVQFDNNENISLIFNTNVDGLYTGQYFEFDISGRIKIIGNYENHKKVNEWSYFKNGILESRGNYLSDLKEGKWLYFYSDGSILKIENYQKGRLSKVKTYKQGKKLIN